MIQDLEDALGEVEFKNGMPDVKFSRVRITSMLVNYVPQRSFFTQLLNYLLCNIFFSISVYLVQLNYLFER